jgi:hypothetical protein
MASLFEEAKNIIELSLDPNFDKKAYAQKASQWLEKTASAQQAHKESDHEKNTCAVCGFDLICPSCGVD